jgi:hypothetical protein
VAGDEDPGLGGGLPKASIKAPAASGWRADSGSSIPPGLFRAAGPRLGRSRLGASRPDMFQAKKPKGLGRPSICCSNWSVSRGPKGSLSMPDTRGRWQPGIA